MPGPVRPELPGLTPRRPLGRGAEAPWVVRAADGTWLVVRRAVTPPTTEVPEHPCLLPALGAMTDAAGRLWVVTAYRSGSGLDRRIDRVGGADPELARSTGVAVARALAALHAAGLVHGDLAPNRVLLGGRDEVLLDASCARAGTEADRLDDLVAWADLLESVCTPLQGSLARAASSAREGAAAATLVEVLGLPGPRRPRTVARHARRRAMGRTAGAALVAGALVAAAALLGVRLAAAPAPTASLDAPVAAAVEESASSRQSVPVSGSGPAPEVTPSPDWTSVLGALDRARGAAFASADPALLAAVDLPGSTAHRRDLVLVEALRRGGAVAEGWATVQVSVGVRRASSTSAVLQVTDRLRPYVLRGTSGEVVERRPAGAVRHWSITLVSTPDGWRISSVRTPG